jgi:hypothetical protein
LLHNGIHCDLAVFRDTDSADDDLAHALTAHDRRPTVRPSQFRGRGERGGAKPQPPTPALGEMSEYPLT